MPKISEKNLNLNADNIVSGTLSGARLPSTLPAINGAALTGITASQVNALSISGGTLTGAVVTAASSSGSVGFRLPPGAAPGSLTAGDLWTTTTTLNIQLNGASKTIANLFDSQTWAGVQTLNNRTNLPAGTTLLAPLRFSAGVAQTSPTNGDMWATTTNLQMQFGGATKTFGQLETNQSWIGAQLYVAATTATNAIGVQVTGDGGNRRLQIVGDGTHNWGDGSGVMDTNLYRSAAGTLKTDSAFTVGGLLSTVVNTTTAAGLRIPHGPAMSGPTNGDVWTTTTGFFARINGSSLRMMASNNGDTFTIAAPIFNCPGQSAIFGGSAAAAYLRLRNTGGTEIGVLQVDQATSNVVLNHVIATGSLLLQHQNTTYGELLPSGRWLFGGATDDTTSAMQVAGNFRSTGEIITSVAGKGLSIKEGSNARMGAATLVAGTKVVSTTAVQTGDRIFISLDTPNGTLGSISAPTSAIVNATSFTINSSSATDTSVVNWHIIRPA